MAIIGYGSKYNTSSSVNSSPNLKSLGGGKFINFFRNGNPIAQIVTVSSETVVTYGAETVIDNTISTLYLSCTVLSSSLVVFTYNNSDGTDFYAIAGSISGNTITLGSRVTVSTGTNGSGVDISKVSSNSAVIAFSRQTGGVNARVLTVSGLTITLYTAALQLWSGSFTGLPWDVQISEIDLGTKYLVTFYGYNPDYYIYTGIITLSGTTVSQGGITYIGGYTVARNQRSTRLSSSKSVIVYTYRSGSYDILKYHLLNTSTTTPSNVTSGNFNSGNTAAEISLVGLSSSLFVVSFSSSTGKGISFAPMVSSDVVTIGSSVYFNNTAISSYQGTYMEAINTNDFILTYSDGGNSNYFTYIVGQIPPGKKINGDINSIWNGSPIVKYNGV